MVKATATPLSNLTVGPIFKIESEGHSPCDSSAQLQSNCAYPFTQTSWMGVQLLLVRLLPPGKGAKVR